MIVGEGVFTDAELVALIAPKTIEFWQDFARHSGVKLDLAIVDWLGELGDVARRVRLRTIEAARLAAASSSRLMSAAEVAPLLRCDERTVRRRAEARGVGRSVGGVRIFTDDDVKELG